MSGNRILVDTNILIYFLKGRPELDEVFGSFLPVISIITELELLSFHNLDEDEEQIIRDLIDSCEVLQISGQIKEAAIRIRRSTKLRLPDSMVAASAKIENIPLVTADIQFEKVKGLDLLLFKP